VDPGFDIDGIDAAHKLTIMMALAYGQPFSFDKVMTEGISHITSSDIQYASEMGFAIKPLAVVRRSEGAIAAKVYPALVEFDRILSQVNGVMNAVEVESDFAGRLFFSGPGAGSLATASAVVSDLGLIARNQGSVYPRLTGMGKVGITYPDQSISSCYLRFDVVDEKGIFARITSALSESGISIDEVFQKNLDGGRASIVMITHPASEKDIDNCLSNVGELSELLKPIQRIRVLS
jgi:homoserine dehydrogenase